MEALKRTVVAVTLQAVATAFGFYMVPDHWLKTLIRTITNGNVSTGLGKWPTGRC